MGQALIKGLCNAGVSSRRITVVEANTATRQQVIRRYRVNSTTLERMTRHCGVVIIAVKPQDFRPVLHELKRRLQRTQRHALLISIAAGVKIATIERLVGRMPVVRVMPNLAATVGCAISAVAAGRWARHADRRIACAIFRCVGEAVELPERLFDVVTAISGSGPAYFFLIFKALRDAGMQRGLPKAIAQQLAVSTAIGSAQLAKGSHDEFETLIAQVASKKGTTEAALKVFHQCRLSHILQAGVAAATKRSKELSSHYLSYSRR